MCHELLHPSKATHNCANTIRNASTVVSISVEVSEADYLAPQRVMSVRLGSEIPVYRRSRRWCEPKTEAGVAMAERSSRFHPLSP